MCQQEVSRTLASWRCVSKPTRLLAKGEQYNWFWLSGAQIDSGYRGGNSILAIGRGLVFWWIWLILEKNPILAVWFMIWFWRIWLILEKNPILAIGTTRWFWVNTSYLAHDWILACAAVQQSYREKHMTAQPGARITTPSKIQRRHESQNRKICQSDSGQNRNAGREI